MLAASGDALTTDNEGIPFRTVGVASNALVATHVKSVLPQAILNDDVSNSREISLNGEAGGGRESSCSNRGLAAAGRR